MPRVSDIKPPGTRGRCAALVVCLLALVAVAAAAAVGPAQAQARRIYINAELSQSYAAVRPVGQRWHSTATVSAYYQTTSQALSAGDGTLVLAPRATVGRFAATLTAALPTLSRDCTWHGVPSRRDQLAELQVGTPFAHALAIEWPGYPVMWAQALSGSSTPGCTSSFTDNPLQGAVTWALGPARGTGGGNHFLFAAASRDAAVESGPFSASIAGMTMRSLLTVDGGQSDAVSAQGFIIESTVPFAGRRNVLAAPAIRADGKPAAPLSMAALRKLALTVVPKRIPRGCVAGQRRRRGQRCP